MVSFHVLSMPEIQVGSLIWELTSQSCSMVKKQKRHIVCLYYKTILK